MRKVALPSKVSLSSFTSHVRSQLHQTEGTSKELRRNRRMGNLPSSLWIHQLARAAPLGKRRHWLRERKDRTRSWKSPRSTHWAPQGCLSNAQTCTQPARSPLAVFAIALPHIHLLTLPCLPTECLSPHQDYTKAEWHHPALALSSDSKVSAICLRGFRQVPNVQSATAALATATSRPCEVLSCANTL